MIKPFYLVYLFLLVLASTTAAQTTDSLRRDILEVLSKKNAVVGVSIIGPNRNEKVSINGDRHLPLQSVFKFHIALAVLSEVDKGRFALDQKIQITKKEMIPDLYSPIRDKYPDGVTLPLSEIIGYTVSQSDNVGCDTLLRLLGGPSVVEQYLKKHGFKNVSIKINEETQQSNWDLQFQNWTTADAANEALLTVYINKRKLLSKDTYDFLWRVMRETETGKARLRGRLPADTVVAHKTGFSGTNKAGVTAAVNDIGIVFLPNGKHFFISVFVSDSHEDLVSNERIIADIAKLAWDHFDATTK